jgi:Domain of unknown function (DUF4338)/Transposase DNA-binding
MHEPLKICGRMFSLALLEELRAALARAPGLAARALATLICHRLAWFSPNGQLALPHAEGALRKLRQRGLVPPSVRPAGPRRPVRLRGSDQPLPPLEAVPPRVEAVRGLHLYLVGDDADALHPLWNDLIMRQHPCGDAKLAGPQLRYLIGSEHGWLGALSFGPGVWQLAARDAWIGWSSTARPRRLAQVLNLSRLLIRTEVRCANLASKVLALAVRTAPAQWEERYGVRPLLLETFVERARFTGCCFAAANWQRLGTSTGRGRLGPKEPAVTPKDIWVYELDPRARRLLQEEVPPPLTPRPLLESLQAEDLGAQELAGLDLGDQRLERRAAAILEARWARPQASFSGSFEGWTPAKGAYGLIEHRSAPLSLNSIIAAHAEATQARMAAEAWVLLPQDTTTLNYRGLRETTGLGPLGESKGRGLWLHTLQAVRPDGVPLGLLGAHCWARAQPGEESAPTPGRNALALCEKESARWVEMLRVASAAARRMPQTQLVVLADREGDLYELHDAIAHTPANLHTLIRAQHDRVLPEQTTLWASLAAAPCLGTRTLELPRSHGQPARKARVELRTQEVLIQAPRVGAKKGWPPVRLHALWVHEPAPPAGQEPIDWMLLSDLPVPDAATGWQRVGWYQQRWMIEEWHRVLKTGCHAEQREFKTAETLQRVLAFDLIIAWRILACLKLGRLLPQLPARVLYSEAELAVLGALLKKSPAPSPPPHPLSRQ